MEDLKVESSICQSIVDGTLSGYKQYLDERKDKRESMVVSGAYAWTRGNHIDDQVSKVGQESGLKFTIAKAGYSWDYLQFAVNGKSEEYMIIIKNARRIKKIFDGDVSKVNDDNYLVKLADVNTGQFEKSSQNYIKKPEQIELELSNPDEIRAVLENSTLATDKKFSRFYIVIYEIDDVTKMIKSIELTMPNRETMDLFQIENLTSYIQNSKYDIITDEDVAPIKNEKEVFSGQANSFGFSVPAKEIEDTDS